jgi:hypothetical protein
MWRTLRWSGTGIGVRPYRVDEASARQDAAFRRAKHLRSLQAARHRRSWREIEAQDARGAFAPDHGAAATRNPPHMRRLLKKSHGDHRLRCDGVIQGQRGA